MNGKIKLYLNFIDIYIIFYIFFLLSYNTKDSFMYISSILFIVLMFLLIPYYRKTNFFNDKKIVCLLIFVLVVGIYSFINDGMLYAAKQIANRLIVFSFIIIYNYWKNCIIESRKKQLIVASLIILLYYMAKSLFAYSINDIEARNLAMNNRSYGDISIGGGYPLAFAITIISVFLLSISKNRKIENSKKILVVFFIILASCVVYLTKSTITIVTFVISICLSFILPVKKKSESNSSFVLKQFLIILIISIAIILLTNIVSRLFLQLSNITTGVISMRLKSFGTVIGGGNDKYAINRLSIALESFRTFLKYPLFGISSFCGLDYYNTLANGAGGHCEWVDALTCFGIIGGLPYLQIFILSIKNIYKNSEINISLLICVLILGLFNPFVNITTSFSLFFLIPAISNQVKTSEKKTKRIAKHLF